MLCAQGFSSLVGVSDCHHAVAVFGLLGAKMVYDIRHRRLSVLHQSRTETTIWTAPYEYVTEHGPICEELSYWDCASHVVCGGAACVMPIHIW